MKMNKLLITKLIIFSILINSDQDSHKDNQFLSSLEKEKYIFSTQLYFLQISKVTGDTDKLSLTHIFYLINYACTMYILHMLAPRNNAPKTNCP